ncbi:MAG TPA: hypothetical protein VN947_15985 [Polyangia bacterium]|nr:hypothetical protein [Polyangia bacterium]
MRKLVYLALLLAGCGDNQLTLHYKLDGINPADVIHVETRVDIDPSDSRTFYVDQPSREVATGILYEVRDDDGDGRRTLLIHHDATIGYVFSPTFEFRLLPPVGGEVAPSLSITASAVGLTDTIGTTTQLTGKFNKEATLAVNLTDMRCSGVACDPTNNETCCNGTSCVNLQGDVANCGACGSACGQTGDGCSGAACRCAGGSACTNGTTCCAGVGCVDLQSDPFHCGGCGNACNPGETCSGGVCKCGTNGACMPAMLCCADTGICSPNGQCACGTSGLICSFPDVCCNGSACVDTKSDNANCGACNHTCAAPLACANGACACNGAICSAGDTCCNSGCANTDTDPQNCGMCGKRCRAGEVCSGGQCLCGGATCNQNQLCCNATCTPQNGGNCGACGHMCKPGETCANNSCSCNGDGACTGNQSCCPAGATTGGGGCFDLATDPNHCGDCNTHCTPGDACVSGHCMATPCNPPCMNGNTCVGGQCRCNGSGACGDNKTCCADGCQDLANDPQNCNACGKKCAAGSYCCEGTCTPPDNSNCTGCGKACTGANKCCVCNGSASCTGLCVCL